MSGSTMRSNSRGERGSPCSVPRLCPTGGVCPCGVINSVVAPLYKLETRQVKSVGRPRNSRTRTNCLWSVEGKAPLKSR